LRPSPLLHKECFTQKLYSQKQCSCWACARAVCSLQDSPFHGGRRNTPKAVKYNQPSNTFGDLPPFGGWLGNPVPSWASVGKTLDSWAVSHQVWSSVSSEQLGHLLHVPSRAVAFVMTFRDRHSVLGPTLILDSHLGWFLSPPCLENYRQICPGSWFQPAISMDGNRIGNPLHPPF